MFRINIGLQWEVYDGLIYAVPSFTTLFTEWAVFLAECGTIDCEYGWEPGWWRTEVCSEYCSCLSLATVLLWFASVTHKSFVFFFKCTFIILNKDRCNWNSRQNCTINVTPAFFSATAVWFIICFLFQVCCFLVGVFFIVCIIRKPTHEERQKEVNGKQTSGMAINSSGERTACLLQASRPAAEYAR